MAERTLGGSSLLSVTGLGGHGGPPLLPVTGLGCHGGPPLLSVTGLGGHGGPPLLYRDGRSRKVAPNFRHTLQQLFIPAYFFVAPGPADVCYMGSGDEARSMAVGDKNHLAGRKELRAEGFEEALFAKRSRYLIENKGKLFSRRHPRLASARRDTTGTGSRREPSSAFSCHAFLGKRAAMRCASSSRSLNSYCAQQRAAPGSRLSQRRDAR